MNTDKLKKDIKKKFGTISKFCRVAGIERNYLQGIFQDTDKVSYQAAQRYKEVKKLLRTTPKRSQDTIELSKDELKQIIAGINERGGVMQFSKDNPEFSWVTLYQIVQGRRKRKSEIVVNLMEKLGIYES